MNKSQAKINRRTSRHNRIRSRVTGTALKPRLSVFRSNRTLYAQLIDDEAGKTLAASDSRNLKGDTPQERAKAVGSDIAAKGIKAGVEKVVFDRGGFRYQGSVAALADAAREAGLTF